MQPEEGVPRAQTIESDLRVLIVEDNMLQGDYLAELLALPATSERLGRRLRVDRAETAAAARRHASHPSRYDVALLDLQIPEDSGQQESLAIGLDLLSWFRTETPSTEVIVTTGYGTEREAVRAIERGAFYFLQKPFQSELVIALIRRMAQLKAFERDELTQLYTKAFFNTVAANEISKFAEASHPNRRKHEPLSIIVADIDHFKLVNDFYGHSEGDRVLRDVAAAISSAVRKTDTVSRWGGEEFTVLLPGAPALPALRRAEMVRVGVLEHRILPAGTTDVDSQVTISVGVATFPMFLEDPSELFDAADRAAYAAKSMGRNQTCGYDWDGTVWPYDQLLGRLEAHGEG